MSKLCLEESHLRITTIVLSLSIGTIWHAKAKMCIHGKGVDSHYVGTLGRYVAYCTSKPPTFASSCFS